MTLQSILLLCAALIQSVLCTSNYGFNLGSNYNNYNKPNNALHSNGYSPSNQLREETILVGVQCPPNYLGLVGYALNCKMFLNCAPSVATESQVETCPLGTLFDVYRKECDYPDKVDCGMRMNPQKPSSDQKSSRYELEEKPEVFPDFGAHDNGIPHCATGVSGLFKHPFDCTQFVNCANGRSFIQKCGSGTVFNPELQICDWPHNVQGCNAEQGGKELDTDYDKPTHGEGIIDVRMDESRGFRMKGPKHPRDHEMPLYTRTSTSNFGERPMTDSYGNPIRRQDEHDFHDIVQKPQSVPSQSLLPPKPDSQALDQNPQASTLSGVYPNNPFFTARTMPPSEQSVPKQYSQYPLGQAHISEPSADLLPPTITDIDPPLSRVLTPPLTEINDNYGPHSSNRIGKNYGNSSPNWNSQHRPSAPEPSGELLPPKNDGPAPRKWNEQAPNDSRYLNRPTPGNYAPTRNEFSGNSELLGVSESNYPIYQPDLIPPHRNSNEPSREMLPPLEDAQRRTMPHVNTGYSSVSRGYPKQTTPYPHTTNNDYYGNDDGQKFEKWTPNYSPLSSGEDERPMSTPYQYENPYHSFGSNYPTTTESNAHVEEDMADALKLLLKPYIRKDQDLELNEKDLADRNIMKLFSTTESSRTEDSELQEPEVNEDIYVQKVLPHWNQESEFSPDDDDLRQKTIGNSESELISADEQDDLNQHDDNSNQYPGNDGNSQYPDLGFKPLDYPEYPAPATTEEPKSVQHPYHHGGRHPHHPHHHNHHHHHGHHDPQNHRHHGPSSDFRHSPEFHRRHPNIPMPRELQSGVNSSHSDTDLHSAPSNYPHSWDYHRRHPEIPLPRELNNQNQNPNRFSSDGDRRDNTESDIDDRQILYNPRFNFSNRCSSEQFSCGDGVCLPKFKECDGIRDCRNQLDEKNCTERLGYEVRLVENDGNAYEGLVEIKVNGNWGYICENDFDANDANVICHELGYPMGAQEVRTHAFYKKRVNRGGTFAMDGLQCTGNETTVAECSFNGWGIHSCSIEQAVGVVCKRAEALCPMGYWMCASNDQCIPVKFLCDEMPDCNDRSDFATVMCDSPIAYRQSAEQKSKGRLEVRHNGVWGTVCEDYFGELEAEVACRSLGYTGKSVSGVKEVIKEVDYSENYSPIWLTHVSCNGTESSLEECRHMKWGDHKCVHTEDVFLRCSNESDTPRITRLGAGTLLTKVGDRSGRVLPTQIEVPERCGHVAAHPLRDIAEITESRSPAQGKHPWQAAIRYKDVNSRSSHICGAVLISKYHLLTTAHCIYRYNVGPYYVRLGDYNSEREEGTEMEVNIKKWYIHENYRNSPHMQNDIALLAMRNPIYFTDYIQPICLPTVDMHVEAEKRCVISGWGAPSSGKPDHTYNLVSAVVPIIDDEVCKSDDVYGRNVTEGMFCAGYLDGHIDACDGDSGGPLVCTEDGINTLFGLISWGRGCGLRNKPGVYVDVSQYINWIQEKVAGSLVNDFL